MNRNQTTIGFLKSQSHFLSSQLRSFWQKISQPKAIKWLLVGSFLSFVLIVTAMITFFYGSYQSMFVAAPVPKQSYDAPSGSPVPTPTPDPDAAFSVLLLGYGGGSHDGGYLTDTLIVAYINPKLAKVTLISLPRDLWVELPVTAETKKGFKINAAYAVGRDDKRYPNKPEAFTGPGGGGALAKAAVSEVTGLDISHFVAVSFNGFTKAIDTLGGITLAVPIAFDDSYYPIEANKNDTCELPEAEIAARTATMSGEKLEQSFSCRYEHLRFEKGSQQMSGELALKYVRSRHGVPSGGDFARSQRQKLVLAAVKNQIFNVNFIPKIIPFTTTLTADMQTDIPLEMLQTWIGRANELKTYSIDSTEITEKNVVSPGYSSDRQFVLQPKAGEFNWSEIHDFVQQAITATASASIKTESATASGKKTN